MRATSQASQANQKNQPLTALSEFWEEMFPKADACVVPGMLKRIQFWVGEQPVLTAAICDYIIKQVSPTRELVLIGSASTSEMSESEADALVDSIVQKDLVESWKESAAADAVAKHFEEISTILLSYDRRDSLLILYLQILQRDQVPANGSFEQAVLLRSGLITVRQGLLKVTVPIYAEIFDLKWIEHQLPGITKPVEIISFPARSSRKMHALRSQLFDVSRRSSKIALGICGLAIAAVAVFAYFKESGSSALATAVTAEGIATKAGDLEVKTLALAQLDSPSNSLSNSSSNNPSDRVLFDEGTDNAKNSRWVPTMRDFCAIPPDSTYFAPAEKQLAQWITLYREDIEIALNTVIQEQNKDCEIINGLLTLPVE